MKKFIPVLLLFLTSCGVDLRNDSVMVTNFGKRSGGSGVIVKSTKNSSYILTNGHVCGVIKNGGLVIDNNLKDHVVQSYKLSTLHDLCMIKIAESLDFNTKLASRAPYRYESATVIGHPKLLPTTITRGDFTDKRLISVMMGLRDCKQSDLDNPNNQLFCLIIGKVPLIKQYEALSLSALIQPGSSGSPVYNSDKQLDALVFAGSGELSFGYAVPFEYIHQFLTEELSFLSELSPVDPNFEQDAAKEKEAVDKYEHLCRAIPESSTKSTICKTVQNYYK